MKVTYRCIVVYNTFKEANIRKRSYKNAVTLK